VAVALRSEGGNIGFIGDVRRGLRKTQGRVISSAAREREPDSCRQNHSTVGALVERLTLLA